MIGFLMITARLLGFVFQAGGLTDAVSSFLYGLPLGRYGTLAIICLLYIMMGMFLDGFSMMLLTLPFVMPIMLNLNFNPIWWGVILVFLLEVSVITPPFGLNLFAVHGVIPEYSLETITLGSLPFLVPIFITIGILVAFPELALWLPNILY